MSRHFSGSLLAAFVLLFLVGIRLYVVESPDKQNVEKVGDVPLISFEKSDLVGIHIQRPDLTVALKLIEGEWEMEDFSWRANRTMARRVAHQIHALTARSLVSSNADDLSLYGLGEGAIAVRLTLKSGEEKSFRVGDPNPTSVSYYVQPLPGNAVYTVQKAAMDYYREGLTAFREPRFAWFQADDANQIRFSSKKVSMTFSRVGPKSWQMTEPINQNANRERVRQMLGRTGALKAIAYVADDVSADEIAPYGLSDPFAEVSVRLSSGETLSLLVSEPLEEEGQSLANVYRVEDEAVYRAKVGFLEAFEGDIADFRDPLVLRAQDVVTKMSFVADSAPTITMTRGVDGWQWGDGTPIPGSTPRRLSAAVRGLKAQDFQEGKAQTSSFLPVGTLRLTMESGEQHDLLIGPKLVVRTLGQDDQTRRLVKLQGEPTEYTVNNEMWGVLEDVHREYKRHTVRLNERDLESVLTPDTP